MNKTKIEWCDYTWNPITGCETGCEYCYARNLYNRFGWSFEPTFHPDRLNQPKKLKKPAKIFMGSVTDPCAPWVVDEGWMEPVIKVMRETPQHTYMVLTKYPSYIPFFKFPPNVWVGTTVDTQVRADRIEPLFAVPNVRFISFEPLLENVHVWLSEVDWIIIGGLTGVKKFIPPQEWVDDLIHEARRWQVPIFLKDNLHYPEKIQEYPLARFLVCKDCEKFHTCHWVKSRQFKCVVMRSRMGLDPGLSI